MAINQVLSALTSLLLACTASKIVKGVPPLEKGPRPGNHDKRGTTPGWITCKPQVFIHLGDLAAWSGVEYPTDKIVSNVLKEFPNLSSVLFNPPESPSSFGDNPPSDALPYGITLDAYLKDRRQFCPDEFVSLFGYGPGAETIHKLMNTRKGSVDVLDFTQVLSVILFSDPLFIPFKTWSRGTATTGADISQSTPDASPLLHAPWDVKTLSFCIETDYNCAFPGKEPVDGEHKFTGSYVQPPDYINEASALILKKFHDAEGLHHGD